MMPSPAAAVPRSRAPRLRLASALVMVWTLLALMAAPVTAQEGTPTPAVTPPPGAPQLSLTFTELNDSGVSGIATLYADGGQTIVDIRVQDAGPEHPAHIHKGTCDRIDPYPAYPLQNVIDGRSTSVVDASLDDLLAGGYVVDLHMSVNELGTLVVCAPITGTPSASTPPSDGTGGAAASPTVTAAATATATATEPAAPTATATAEATTPETPEPTATIPATPEATGVGGAIQGGSDGTGGAALASTDTASLPLQSLDDLGVTGTASITALNDGQTEILIQLTGGLVTGGHLAHLHLGTCDNLSNDYTLDLEPIDASGFSDTIVDIPFNDLLTGGYAINVHESEENYDTWFVCGEFGNATVGAVVPEVAPETGAGSVQGQAQTPAATVAPTPVGGGAQNLPQQAGSGTGLLLPGTAVTLTMWVILAGGIILAFSALVIRRGEQRRGDHTTQPRWRRLGF